LYDAITAGFERISGADRDTKVLLVISDGGDNASHVSRKQVLDRALRSNVLVYAIGIFDAEDPDRNPATLKRITRATGGESYFPQSLPEVESICAKIAVEIRNQYTIGYIPSNREMNGNYRTISVEATGPRGERLLVRTRSGYVARAGS
jgi:VWFA-related protein